MDHSCYQCGVLVEDGTAFCRQCSAPQIRVAGPELPASAPVPAEDLPSTRPYPVAFPAAMEWSHALSAAALAGLVAAVAMAITGGGFGLGMLASGAFAVLIYHRRSPQTTLTAGVGARLGVVTGFISSVALALLLSLEMAFLHTGDELRKELRSTLLQSICAPWTTRILYGSSCGSRTYGRRNSRSCTRCSTGSRSPAGPVPTPKPNKLWNFCGLLKALL